MRILRIAYIVIGMMFASQLHAQNSFPWKWGMTPAEVQQVTEYAPYHTFSNGDLETYEAPFQNEKKNYQFYFDDGQPRKLSRIAIHFYEGKDIEAAKAEWLKLYGTMGRLFGEMETPDNAAPVADNPDSEKAFAAKAADILKANGKTQMAPFQQFSDEFVFASLRSHVLPEGETYYIVVLNFDKPRKESANPANDSSSTP